MKHLITSLILFQVSITLASQPPAEVIEYSTKKILENSGIRSFYSYEIKINNRKGDNYSNIHIGYSTNKISDLKAELYDSKGNLVKKLKKKDISHGSDISDISLYEDSYFLEFTLRHNSYPYTIKYSYNTFVSQFLHLANWFPALYRNIPTNNSELYLEVPKESKVFINVKGDIKQDKGETEDGNKFYSFRSNYLKQISTETKSAPYFELLPSVTITSNKFQYVKEGSFESWKSYGKWVSEINEGKSDLPDSEIHKIKKMISNYKSDSEKIEVIYKYLQNSTRYINVSIDAGGLETYPASYVVKNRYGDCKALTNYMRSALEVAGIKSLYTLVNAGDDIEKITVDHPGQYFNHVILAVPLQNDTVWLDCTSSFAYNYLGTFTQNRHALITDGENSKLVMTPALTKEQSSVKRTVYYNTHQTTSITDSIYAKGDFYETLAMVGTEYNKKDIEKILNRYFTFTGFMLDSFKLDILSEGIAEAVLFQSSSTFAKRYGNQMMFQVEPLDIVQFEDPEKRAYPVRVDYPEYVIESHHFILEGNKEPTYIPDSVSIQSEFGFYLSTSKLDGNEIVINKTFLLKEGEIPLSNYPELYEFISSVKDADHKLKVLLK